MKKEEAEVLWPIIKAFGEGKTIQLRDGNNWNDVHSSTSMSFSSSTSSYRIKPKEIMVDMSVLIESGIDCEFSDQRSFVSPSIGKLTAIDNMARSKYPFNTNSGDHYTYARPRMNHLHAWTGGDCPLPKGVRVRLYLRSGKGMAGDSVIYAWDHLPGTDHIIAFGVVGLEDGYVYA